MESVRVGGTSIQMVLARGGMDSSSWRHTEVRCGCEADSRALRSGGFEHRAGLGQEEVSVHGAGRGSVERGEACVQGLVRVT